MIGDSYIDKQGYIYYVKKCQIKPDQSSNSCSDHVQKYLKSIKDGLALNLTYYSLQNLILTNAI